MLQHEIFSSKQRTIRWTNKRNAFLFATGGVWAMTFPELQLIFYKPNSLTTLNTCTHDPKMKYTHEAHWHSAAKISRWRSHLRSWWLSAGRVPSPPTTSITLRQKQGGEQRTCSGGPLQKKNLPHTLLSGRMWLLLRVSKFVILTSCTLLGYCFLNWCSRSFVFKKLLCLLSLWLD